MGRIVCGLSFEKSNEIENRFAVLRACIQGAIHGLEEANEGDLACGLQIAASEFKTALHAIWEGGEEHHRPEHHQTAAAGKAVG